MMETLNLKALAASLSFRDEISKSNLVAAFLMLQNCTRIETMDGLEADEMVKAVLRDAMPG